jgi:hypothetical protein
MDRRSLSSLVPSIEKYSQSGHPIFSAEKCLSEFKYKHFLTEVQCLIDLPRNSALPSPVSHNQSGIAEVGVVKKQVASEPPHIRKSHKGT